MTVKSGGEGVVILHTERLVLRPLDAVDLEDLIALHGDAEVMRFITGMGESPDLVQACSLPDLLGRPTWAVLDQGRFIGWTSLRRNGAEAELGYRLTPLVWGRGYASEAARALIALGFGDLGLERIWAQTMAVNFASRRVMEKAGLAHMRTFHLVWENPLPGAGAGEVEYALTRTDWLARRGPPPA